MSNVFELPSHDGAAAREPAHLHDDPAAPPGAAVHGRCRASSTRGATRPARSSPSTRRPARSARSRRCRPGARQRVRPRHVRRAAGGSTFKPIDLAAAVEDGINPWGRRATSRRRSTIPRSAGASGRTTARTPAPSRSPRRRSPLRQHRVRAARARRRAGAIAAMAQKLGVADTSADAVARARLVRGDSARHGLGLRDARRGRRLLAAAAVRKRRLPGSKVDVAWDGVSGERVVPGLGGGDGDARARAEHAPRDGHRRSSHRPRRRREDGDDRARTPTRGSAATRRRSRRRCGWAIPGRRSRCSTSTEPPSRARRCRRRSGGSSWSARLPARRVWPSRASCRRAQFAPWRAATPSRPAPLETPSSSAAPGTSGP